MDIVTTSLDALLQRATNTHNQNIDTAAVEAFCALVSKEKDGAHIGVKLIASRIHSQQEKEALQTFYILDICMQRCGTSFQSEVGKFRFLNEMIKLVSPKYSGSHTPLSVKQKVLQLMYLWTLDYPKETKIKEAYDMLKKQGVIREIPLSDEEKSKLLQKLLQSKNPEDLQAANRLIKSMVKEEDKRAEIKNRRISEMEAVQNNVKLLNEMLDSYKPGMSSEDELDLMKELHQSCERLRLNVQKLISETHQNEEILSELLQASDELGQVFDKYTTVILKKKIPVKSNESSLLDFGSLAQEKPTFFESSTGCLKQDKVATTMDVLTDIFATNSFLCETDVNILQPTSAVKDVEMLMGNCDKGDLKQNNKIQALEDLDALGESLLKHNLSSLKMGSQFNKIPEKIPMNLLPKTYRNKDNLEKNSNDALHFDLNYLLAKSSKPEPKAVNPEDRNGDDLLVDISAMVENKNAETASADANKSDNCTKETNSENVACPLKTKIKLSDIFVKLETIKPSSIPPLVVLEEKNGLSVVLNFAKDKPREDLCVVVATIISKNESTLKNILFQAVVPKVCKLKLQPPSGTELPPFNPFLPPSAVTQIILIANPEKVQVSLKFIISYTVDGETATEMGEIDNLPLTY